MDKKWFKKFIMKIVEDHIDRFLETDLLTSWEIDSLKEAYQNGSLKDDKGLLSLPDGRQWSLMTLNREYLSHIAIYFELIRSGQYDINSIVLEHESLDLVIFEGQVAVTAIEVKKTEREGRQLVKKMLDICQNPPVGDNDRGVDSLRKVRCLLKIHPQNFWVVTPTMRWYFTIQYASLGFKLVEYFLEKETL